MKENTKFEELFDLANVQPILPSSEQAINLKFIKRYGLHQTSFAKSPAFLGLSISEKKDMLIEALTGRPFEVDNFNICYSVVDLTNVGLSNSSNDLNSVIGPFDVDLSIKLDFIRVLFNPNELSRWLHQNRINGKFANLCKNYNVFATNVEFEKGHYIFVITRD
jgi:hypothetical protein